MKIRNVGVLSTIILLALPASHAEIYRWVDSNGKVHFSDKPRDEQSTAIRPSSGNSSGSNADDTYLQQLQEQQRLLDAYSEKRAHEQRQQAAAERKQQEKQKKIDALCKNYSRYLERGGAVYRKGENGERIFLKESEMKTFHAQKQAEFDRLCK